MATIGLKYAGSPDISRPDWALRDHDRNDLAHLAAVAKVSVDDIVERAVATGLFTAINDEPEPAGDGEPGLADHTKAELLELAGEMKLELASKATKAEIIAAIEQRLAEEAAAKAASASSSGESE